MIDYKQFSDKKLTFTCETLMEPNHVKIIINVNNLYDSHGQLHSIKLCESLACDLNEYMDVSDIFYDIMDKLFKEVLKVKLHKLFSGGINEIDPMYQDMFNKMYVNRLKFMDVFFDEVSMNVLKDTINKHLKQKS